MKYYYDKSIVLYIYIMQIVAIYNAMMMGWQVKKIGQRKYELSKKINELQDFKFDSFINDIITI